MNGKKVLLISQISVMIQGIHLDCLYFLVYLGFFLCKSDFKFIFNTVGCFPARLKPKVSYRVNTEVLSL